MAYTIQLAKTDAVLIVSPEYNYSIPGGLKNAIDRLPVERTPHCWGNLWPLWGAA